MTDPEVGIREALADILRERGWTVTPPSPPEHQIVKGIYFRKRLPHREGRWHRIHYVWIGRDGSIVGHCVCPMRPDSSLNRVIEFASEQPPLEECCSRLRKWLIEHPHG